MLLTNFENLNFTSNIFQEKRDILVLTDALIICIYVRTIDRYFRDQENIRYPTSKLLKCDLVQILNTFRKSSLWIFAAGKASLVWHLLSWSMSLLEPYFFEYNNMFINFEKDLILPTFQKKSYFPTSQIQGFSPLNFF